MNWYIKVLKQFDDFRGRARRREYWMFVLFNLLFYILGWSLVITGIYAGLPIFTVIMFVLLGLYSLLMLIPNLAVVVRRLHDVGQSGFMVFIVLIPLIGILWFIILLLTDSQPNENEWGRNPKEKEIDPFVIDEEKPEIDNEELRRKKELEYLQKFMPPAQRA